MSTHSRPTISRQQAFKKALLGGVSLLAVTAMLGMSGTAMAAGDDTDSGNDTADSTITLTDTGGLLINDSANQAITIDSTNGAIVLGTVATTDALTRLLGVVAVRTDTITVTTSSTNNLVTFAGDIDWAGSDNGDDILVLNVTNTTTLFQGDVTRGGAATMTIGAGTETLTTTFDTAVAANNVIDMLINANAAADTITMAVTNSEGTAGTTMTFSGAIGGGSTTTAIDILTLGEATETTFTGTVRADTITVSTIRTTTFNGDITGALNFAADGTVSLGNATDVTGAITTSTTNTGTLALVGGADVTLAGAIGASGKVLKAITTDITGEAAAANTFTADIFATTITITGTNNSDEVLFQGDVTGNVVIVDGALLTVTADKKFVGNITTTAGDGIITFGTAGASTILVSGTVGTSGGNALNRVNVVTGGSFTSTFDSTVDATIIDLSGSATGTVAFTGAVTASTRLDFTGATLATAAQDVTTALVDFGADGTLTMAANKKIVGAVNNTTGGDTIGNLAFTATTTNTTLVSGNVGATNTLKLVTVAPASGITAIFGGTYDVTTTTHSGAGTVAFAGAVGTAGPTTVNISGGGLVTLAVTSGTGNAANIDNTGTTGTGTLTLAAGIDLVGNIGTANPLATVNFDSTGNTTMTGTVAATTINLAGTGTVAFTNNDVTGIVNFTAAATATVTADEKIVGSVTTSADGQGTLTFAVTTTDTTLVNGNVGTSSNALLAVTAGGATGGVDAIFGGDVFADTFNIQNNNLTGTVQVAGDVRADTGIIFDAAGVFILNGTGAQSISGAITQTVASENIGDITVSNTGGTVTFASALGTAAANGGLGDLTLSASTTTVFQGALNVEELAVTGAVTFESTVTADGAVTINDNATITVGSGIAAGTTLITTTTASVDPASTAGATFVLPSNFTTGTITLIDGSVGTGLIATNFTVTDTALVNYTLADANGNQDLTVAASKNSASSIASTLGVTTQEATALSEANTAVAVGDAEGFTALNTALVAGGAEVTTAAEQVAVQADTLGAGTAAMVGVGGQVIGAASSRLASLRSGVQYASVAGTGFSSGDAGLSMAGWIKPFGNWIRQDTHEGVKGFDADTYGIAAGIDSEVTKTKGMRLGASFAYSRTDVDGKGTGQSQSDINSYQVTVYGDYTAKKYYVEAMAGYARNDTDTSRKLTFQGLDRTVKGDYYSNQYMVSVGGGMPIKMKDDSFITPTASLSWTHVESDSYTETGGGGFSQRVNPDNVDVIVGSLGAKVHTRVKSGKGFFVPVARFGLSYDFAGDEAQASATFTGGGAAFTVTGAEVEQFGGNAGLGLAYENGAFTVAANYDAELKEDFVAHSATFEASFKF